MWIGGLVLWLFVVIANAAALPWWFIPGLYTVLTYLSWLGRGRRLDRRMQEEMAHATGQAGKP